MNISKLFQLFQDLDSNEFLIFKTGVNSLVMELVQISSVYSPSPLDGINKDSVVLILDQN